MPEKEIIRLSDPESNLVPFVFKRGDYVRSKLDRAMEGHIIHGWCNTRWRVADPSEEDVSIMYHAQTQNGTLFGMHQQDLELVEEYELERCG